ATVVLAACGGGAKAPPGTGAGAGTGTGEPPPAPAATTPTRTDSAGPAHAPPMPDGSAMMPTGKDSVALMERKKALRDSTPLRDSAFGPKFTVDSTGKVVPIKRPKSPR
ncbi:MAG TPA: hypothetical protein VG916_10055, partial [Gemmatimonadaceae bacterium]|nr:hypothetical protein [Gemmatimonadaceae bacterium]